MEYYHEKVETEIKVPAKINFGNGEIGKLRYPLHWHHNLEFNLVLEGQIRGKINGRPEEAKKGEIFFVNSGLLHETDATGEVPIKAITLLLSESLLREYCPDLDLWSFSIEKGSSQEQRIAERIRVCAELYKNRPEYYELEMAIELRRICRILLQECRKEKKESTDSGGNWRGIKRVKKAISYMEQNYAEEITLKEMADVMGMTAAYFSRFFKQSTGQNFHSYLTWIRLEHVLQQIQTNEVSVTELAMDNGFPNVKSFIQAFQKEYGVTPGNYIKNLGTTKR